MMRKVIPLFLTILTLTAALGISVGSAGALPLAGTPFSIPTSTPSGGTSSNPAQGQLTEEQMYALNLQPEDVPAEFAANPQQQTYILSDLITSLQPSSPDLADQLQTLAQAYGWTTAYDIYYTYCEQSVPISKIGSETAQLSSPEAAQQIIDDPEFQTLYGSLGYTVSDTKAAHGFFMAGSPGQGTCFPTEVSYDLTFEYQGFLLSLSMDANQDTDASMVQGLLEQLIPVMTAKIDALIGTAQPATVGQATSTPKPPSPGLSNGFSLQQNTPAAGAPALTLDTLAGIVPSIEDIGLPSPPYQLNAQGSGTATRDDMITNYNAANLPQLADVTDKLGGTTGLVGQVVTIWDTAGQCPRDVPAVLLELDLTLFETADGAQTFASDPSWVKIWTDFGFTYEPYQSGDINGYLIKGENLQHQCGTATFMYLYVPHGSVLITVGSVALQGNEDTVQQGLDAVAGMMIQTLDAQTAGQ